jgi:CheY-like chemotaxis protein
MRILVADDEEPCRMLLQDLFVAEPHIKLTMARDGAEAWWLLTDPMQIYDLCIFDLRMPVVDGLKLIERIRGVSSFRSLPIILCTATNDRDTVAKAARLAITQYVVKPYRAEAMREKIRSALLTSGRIDKSVASV